LDPHHLTQEGRGEGKKLQQHGSKTGNWKKNGEVIRKGTHMDTQGQFAVPSPGDRRLTRGGERQEYQRINGKDGSSKKNKRKQGGSGGKYRLTGTRNPVYGAKTTPNLRRLTK